MLARTSRNLLEFLLTQFSVAVVRSEKLVTEAQGEFANPEEEERPPLEAATKQRLVKTEKALCVL
jgi:hypothetical protein